MSASSDPERAGGPGPCRVRDIRGACASCAAGVAVGIPHAAEGCTVSHDNASSACVAPAVPRRPNVPDRCAAAGLGPHGAVCANESEGPRSVLRPLRPHERRRESGIRPPGCITGRAEYPVGSSRRAEGSAPNTYRAERTEISVSREFAAAMRERLPGWRGCDANCGEQARGVAASDVRQPVLRSKRTTPACPGAALPLEHRQPFAAALERRAQRRCREWWRQRVIASIHRQGKR